MKSANHYADEYNAYEKEPKKIRVLDSTLREGEQHPGVSFTNKQRIQIAWMLDYFGVDQIEISPVVSPDHKEATKTIIKQGLKADIVSHGRALKEDIDISLSCDAKWVAAYLGISDIHLKDKLRITKEQALERAVETVSYAKQHGLNIRFTVEDGSRAEPQFLMKVCKAIEEAGAVGIEIEAVPPEVGKAVDDAVKIFTFSIGAGGAGCGQLLLGADLIGAFDDFKPKFAKRFGNIGEVATNAFRAYAEEVRMGMFPGPEHSYQMPSDEANKLASFLATKKNGRG